MDEVQDCIDRNFDAVRKQMGIIYADEVLSFAENAIQIGKESRFQKELHQSFARWSAAQWMQPL
jgi:hypothetical protein